MAGDTTLGATDGVMARIAAVQFSLGEGPSVDAYHEDRPVLEPDLADPSTPRWLGFANAAVEAGARAVFAFPLHVGSVRLGALNFYCDRPGALGDEPYIDALVMADVAAQAVLAMQAQAPPGTLATELERGAEFHYVVHQASGMVSAQLDVGVDQALIRLRAYAFGNDLVLADVAQDVVDRRLRFDDRSGEDDHGP
jgi:hypothetical protein